MTQPDKITHTTTKMKKPEEETSERKMKTKTKKDEETKKQTKSPKKQTVEKTDTTTKISKKVNNEGEQIVGLCDSDVKITEEWILAKKKEEQTTLISPKTYACTPGQLCVHI